MSVEILLLLNQLFELLLCELVGDVGDVGAVRLARRPSVKVARWQNLIPSLPWIAPRWRAKIFYLKWMLTKELTMVSL